MSVLHRRFTAVRHQKQRATRHQIALEMNDQRLDDEHRQFLKGLGGLPANGGDQGLLSWRSGSGIGSPLQAA
jgi:hypothetical protein